jgi:hypothetical protein
MLTNARREVIVVWPIGRLPVIYYDDDEREGDNYFRTLKRLLVALVKEISVSPCSSRLGKSCPHRTILLL